jgi:uncharacterized protein (TIGR02594 family)
MTHLPTQYQWLKSLRGLPNTIRLGLAEYGVAEVVGKGSNRTIIDWRDDLNGATTNGKPLVIGFSDDDIPWCGLYAAIICYRRIKRIEEVVRSPLWARNWTRYGVKADKPALGDVLVFSRGSGGHVGFYVAEDSACYHVIGGNQGNRVSIIRIAKSRLLAARRPPYVVKPSACKQVRVAAAGAISLNEA